MDSRSRSIAAESSLRGHIWGYIVTPKELRERERIEAAHGGDEDGVRIMPDRATLVREAEERCLGVLTIHRQPAATGL